MKSFLKQSNTTTVISERQQRNDKLTQAHMIDTVTKFDCDERVLGENGGSYLKHVPVPVPWHHQHIKQSAASFLL